MAVLWGLYRFILKRLARRFQDNFLPNVMQAYERQLRWALSHRGTMLAGTSAVFVVTGVGYGLFGLGTEFFPESMPPGEMVVQIETPVGTRAEVTDEFVRELEQELNKVGGRADWVSVVSVTGSGGGRGGGNPRGGGPTGPEGGRLSVSLVDFQDRERDAFETLAEMQATVGTQIAGAKVTVDKIVEGPPSGIPVSIEISGENPDELKELSDELLGILEGAPVYPKLVGLESDLDEARPELAVAIDREKAALYDLNTSRVGNAIRGAINGTEAAKYRTGNDEYDIIVRLADPYRNELEGLRELTVMAEGGVQIPLVSMATWSVEGGAGAIRRKDQERMATITSDVAAGYTNNAVMEEVQETLTQFEGSLPPGYTMRYTGQSEEQDEAQAFLSGAFLTALMLIGFILISQFNSIVKPVIILTSVIMSTIGVLLGLMIFRMPFGIINTGVGIISLAGIVVNNAIILIDYIDVLRKRDGMDLSDALVTGGKTRLRPVVLTALTTALGLVPLAIGLNFDFFGFYGALDPEFYWGGEQVAWWGSMCVAIIAGILFATFLTLILVPVMYSLVDELTSFLRLHFLHGEESGLTKDGSVGQQGQAPPFGTQDPARMPT
ncbi:MAG: hypothetical protein Ct9H300mP15_07940 [Gemmatimonadota bacterium]|nr:MAG: hypothetical protein Ct9H300mP15_07940 [Gemmatimonadota bacterium]